MPRRKNGQGGGQKRQWRLFIISFSRHTHFYCTACGCKGLQGTPALELTSPPEPPGAAVCACRFARGLRAKRLHLGGGWARGLVLNTSWTLDVGPGPPETPLCTCGQSTCLALSTKCLAALGKGQFSGQEGQETAPRRPASTTH